MLWDAESHSTLPNNGKMMKNCQILFSISFMSIFPIIKLPSHNAHTSESENFQRNISRCWNIWKRQKKNCQAKQKLKIQVSNSYWHPTGMSFPISLIFVLICVKYDFPPILELENKPSSSSSSHASLENISHLNFMEIYAELCRQCHLNLNDSQSKKSKEKKAQNRVVRVYKSLTNVYAKSKHFTSLIYIERT